MKRLFLLTGFFLFSISVFCQNMDSLAVVRDVDSLIQVSRALTGQNDFDKALEVSAVAEKLALEKLGRESAAYGSCCFNLGRVNYFKKDYSEAEKWYLESKGIREKVLGKEHPDYATTLYILGYLYNQMGYDEKAERYTLESKIIRGKVLGKEHLDYASSLNSLGIIYFGMGNYEESEQIFLEVRAIREKVLGKEHPDYVRVLNNLSAVYHEMGNDEKAESFSLEVKTIREKTLGKEHPDYAVSLRVLAGLYESMGMDENTVPLLHEARAILEKNLGKEHPEYASTLHNLGVCYLRLGNYEKAEFYLLEAKAIWEIAPGNMYLEHLISLASLGVLYTHMGFDEKAESLMLESKALCEKTVGKEHPKYAISLLNLGGFYSDKGDYQKAELCLLEAKAILEKVLGKEHPDYSASLINLTSLYEKQKRRPESELLQKELAMLNQSRLAQSASFLSVRELTNYIATFQKESDNLSAYILARTTGDGQTGTLSELALSYTLFYKGFLLTSAARLNALSAASPESEELSLSLKGYRQRLATEYAKPIAMQKNVTELEEKANTAEKKLARTVAGYAKAIQQIKWQEVQSALKPAEVAIEFVHFKVNFPKTTDSVMYAALMLLPGTEQPIFIPLFEQKSLDSLLQTLGERRADYVNGLYSKADRGAKPIGKPQKTLYELLWQPLEKQLLSAEGTKADEGTKTIYYSPSGLLHRLNLAAILISIDSVLGDRYQLVELGSTRQLVAPSEVKLAANDAILVGGILYESDSTAIALANAALDSITIASRGELSFSYTDSTLRLGAWGTLPFTDREVSSLERILKTAGIQADTRRGYAATEEAFKTIGAGGKPSPRILHIATHGFFFPDPAVNLQSSTVNLDPVFKLSDHPMIRSGLLLAGANQAWATGKPLREGMEDGILTAYEISQMNLSNTELVVLSACETGLGDIQGNEGVYGLQRAFKIAGAKYLIMSLWQVPDKQTSLLMTTFYKKWLGEKMAIPEAFRAAQKELREAGLDPYQWAGFVLVE